MFKTIAIINRHINHGIWILREPFSRKLNIEIKESGIIQRARVSFTVVATASASGPKIAAAPTTELVSCMAMADQSPNCSWVNPSTWPMGGNTNRATAFSVNTTASDREVSFSSAPITGATAAIALPPQMAVPEDTRCVSLGETFIHRPMK